MRRILLLLLILLVTQISAARNETTPEARSIESAKTLILPLGYRCTMTVYQAANGMKATQAPATVEAYMVWAQPLRLEYYVSDEVNGVKYWNTMSRETLDATCN